MAVVGAAAAIGDTGGMSTLPASSASAGVGRTCHRHADAAGNHTCSTCRRPMCEGCVAVGVGSAGYGSAGFGGGEVCVACADEGRRRGRTVMAASVVGAALIVVGGIAFVASRPASIEYGEHRFEIERLSARVEQSKCDGQSTLEFADLLNKERDYPRVIRVVDEFDAACAPVPRLHWESYGARMQVQDFQGAIHDATVLIDNDKDDGDFWWWRAKAKRKAGDVTGAEADLRRSAEISGQNAFWAVIDLADVLESQQRGCEAVPLLAQVARNHAEQAKKVGLTARVGRLVRETPCPDINAALPAGDEHVAALCTTLPAKLVVDTVKLGWAEDLISGFAFSLANTWEARTRTVAQGAPVACRAQVLPHLAGGFNSSDFSWSGRLTCEGLPTTTAHATSSTSLEAQEMVVGKLIDASVRRWCGLP